MQYYDVEQRSPTFLAPGTGFMEDNFSTDGGWWSVEGGGYRGNGLGGNVSDGERHMKLGSLAHRSTPAVGPGS